MIRSKPCFLLVCFFLFGCSTVPMPLEKASMKYKHDKDFISLEFIHSKLFKGMQRNKAESLLGKPDYSPIEGQYYYSSTRTEYSEEQERDVTVGMVINYNDSNGVTTQYIQNFWIGPIGE